MALKLLACSVPTNKLVMTTNLFLECTDIREKAIWSGQARDSGSFMEHPREGKDKNLATKLGLRILSRAAENSNCPTSGFGYATQIRLNFKRVS